ncbi:MAG: hypothetical protein WHV67_02480 [Thermoanaerobaculia bacterium]
MSEGNKSSTSFAGFLLEASAEALKEVLINQKEKLTENEVLAILKNKNIDLEVVKIIISHKPFLISYEVKKSLLFLRLTPYTEGLKLLPHMYWMDLLLLSTNMSVHPLIRRSAEKKIIEKLPEMELGEKITLARRGSYNVILHLAKEKNPKVIEALLQNRFATEEIVLSIAGNQNSTPEILGLINYSTKWKNRMNIKKALVLNPNFPTFLACHLLKTFNKTNLEEFASNPYLSDTLKNYCKKLLAKTVKEN